MKSEVCMCMIWMTWQYSLRIPILAIWCFCGMGGCKGQVFPRVTRYHYHCRKYRIFFSLSLSLSLLFSISQLLKGLNSLWGGGCLKVKAEIEHNYGIFIG
ncbi:hypothetical protein F4774DRAFT_403489 [Daldinia eschscholtzii]|nr:hypothetical protein F4774DRAFT_403489 [Daldinia eschscholtzii]